MEMEEQYGMADLRQYMNGRPHFPATLQPGDLFSGERNLTQATQHYEMVRVASGQMSSTDHMVSLGLHEFGLHDYNNTSTSSLTATCTASLNALEMEGTGGLGGDGGTGRWPRQETLTLLEIRSRLDSKFKEANHQKGPLWDEISRIMSEEHGYQRSGKKCREKFENLYKYYKKTKEGKVGRQDGKHYRFFRQLEALCGKTSNPAALETHLVANTFPFHSGSNNSTQCNQELAYQAPKQLSAESLSLCSSSDFDSSSSDDDNDNIANASMLMDNDSMGKRKKRRGRSWKAKIRDFVDEKMRKILEKQEAWLEKIMETLEQKEQERMLRDEEWRKQETARIDRENKFWTNERAWIEARDAALMEALQKLMGNEVKVSSPELGSLSKNQKEIGSETSSLITFKGESWPECEVTRLIQLRTSMESRFQQCGCAEDEVLWEEIAAKMGCLGYDRNALMCKDKWNKINNYLSKTKESNKKRKENSRSCFNFQNNESIDHNIQAGGGYCEIIKEQGSELTRLAANHGALSPNSSGSNGMHDSCFRFLMGDGGNLWENFGVKLSKGES